MFQNISLSNDINNDLDLNSPENQCKILFAGIKFHWRTCQWLRFPPNRYLPCHLDFDVLLSHKELILGTVLYQLRGHQSPEDKEGVCIEFFNTTRIIFLSNLN